MARASEKLQSELLDLLASMDDNLSVLRVRNDKRELVEEVQQIVDEIKGGAASAVTRGVLSLSVLKFYIPARLPS